MRLLSTLAVVTLFTAVGCGGEFKPAKIETESACSSQFLTDYHLTVFTRNRVRDVADRSAVEVDLVGPLVTMKKACEQFLTAHAGTSCRVELDGISRSLRTSDRLKGCKAADTLLDLIVKRTPRNDEI